MGIKLTVGIATAERPRLLARTLGSLASCALPDGYCGTIVVENGPKCGVEEISRQCPPHLAIRYMYLSEPNKSRALNALLRAAGDCLVVFFDDDVRIARSALTSYSGAAENGQGRSYFGGPLGVDYESEPPQWLVPHLPRAAKGWSWDPGSETAETVFFLGANWALFVSDAIRAGGFEPTRGPHPTNWTFGEETLLQRRLKAMRLSPVYLESAKVWHYVPPERCSPAWALRRAYRLGIEQGLEHPDHSTRLFGVPRWLVGRCVRQGLARAMNWRGGTCGRFARHREFWFHLGMLVGNWRARRAQADRPQEGSSHVRDTRERAVSE